MKPRIAIVDYGAGNVASVRRGLDYVGAETLIARDAATLERADGLVIPGVGHFETTAAVEARLRDAIVTAAGRRPVLGVCVGLQFLFEGSDEAPDVPGLGLLPGRCFRLPARVKVPHVGWNSIEIGRASLLLKEIAEGTSFYFTHSFAAPLVEACVASTQHGTDFASVVERGNVAGVQFHPEKSGHAGLQVLQNFVARC